MAIGDSNRINNQPSFFQSLNQEAGNVSSITKALETVDKINADEKNPINISMTDLLGDNAGGAFQIQLDNQDPGSDAARRAEEATATLTASRPDVSAIPVPDVLEPVTGQSIGQRIGSALTSFGQSPDIQAGALSIAEAIGGGRQNLSSTGLGGFIDVLRSGAEANQLRQSLLAADEEAGGSEDSPISRALDELPSFGITPEQVLATAREAQSIQQAQTAREATEAGTLATQTQFQDRLGEIRARGDEAIKQIQERQNLTPEQLNALTTDTELKQTRINQINQQIATEKDPNSLQNLKREQDILNAQVKANADQVKASQELSEAENTITIGVFRDFTQDLPDVFRAEAIFGENFDFEAFETGADIQREILNFPVVPEGDDAIARGAAITQATKDQLLRRFTALQRVIPSVQRLLGATATPNSVSKRIRERFVFGTSDELGLRQTSDTVTTSSGAAPVFRNEANEAFTQFAPNAFIRLIVRGEGR